MKTPTLDKQVRSESHPQHNLAFTDQSEIEKRYLRLLKKTPLPMAIHAGNEILEINSAACEVMGESEAFFIGRNIFEFVHPDYLNIVKKRIRNALRGEELPVLEEKFIRPDGNIIDVEVMATTVPYQETFATQVFFRDITVKKKNQRMHAMLLKLTQMTDKSISVYNFLKTVHTELDQVFEAKNVFLATYEAQNELYSFLYFSDEMQTSPIPIHAQMTHSLTDYVRREGKAMIISSQQRDALIEQGRIEQVGPRAKSWMAAPFKIAEGIEGILVVQSYAREQLFTREDLDTIRILTQPIAGFLEKRRTEGESRKSELRFKALTEKISEIFVILGRDWRCTYVSPSIAQFGYVPVELLGTFPRNLVHPEDLTTLNTAISEALPHQGSVVLLPRFRLRIKDGSWRLLEGLLTFLPYHPGVEGIVFNGRDITGRAKQEQEQQKFQEKLNHVQKLDCLGVLAGGIAHDFNNLLVAMLGNAELALTRLDANSEVSGYIHEIEKAASRAADLCKQMLAYSGRGKFIIKNINLNDIAREMIQMLNVTISKQITLIYECAADLPLIEADATQLRQVILNLITNANDALESQSGVIKIETGIFKCCEKLDERNYAGNELQPGEYVFLKISDTGKGMDNVTKTRLFDPFYSTKFTGRGLGLSAVLGIMRGHNGGIIVDSELATGCTFTLLFPPAPNQDVRPISPISKQHQGIGQNGRILVVDDEALVRNVALQMLHYLGYKTEDAEDGKQALEILQNRSEQISCILLDLIMPRVDGQPVYTLIKEKYPDIPLVLTSGCSEEELKTMKIEQNYVGFLAKPFVLSKLKQLISQAVNKS